MRFLSDLAAENYNNKNFAAALNRHSHFGSCIDLIQIFYLSKKPEAIKDDKGPGTDRA